MQAEAYLLAHANRSEYIINCILKAEEQGAMLSAIQELMQGYFGGAAGAAASVAPSPVPTLKQMDCPIPESSELSADMLQFAEEG